MYKIKFKEDVYVLHIVFTLYESRKLPVHFQIMITGRPISILTVNPDDTFCLDEDALRSVLNKQEVNDKPVCLIPVAGTEFEFVYI